MSDIRETLDRFVEAASATGSDVEHLRTMSMQERGRQLAAACRLAASIERGKIDSGLPPSQPVPWPQSTWEFLKKHAPNGKQ